MSAPRVFLVDDHQMFRAGVRAELGDTVEVVGEAADVESAAIADRDGLVIVDTSQEGGELERFDSDLSQAAPGAAPKANSETKSNRANGFFM